SLSQLSMVRYWLQRRRRERIAWGLAINGFALLLCVAILIGTIYHKGQHGGWVTIVVTSGVVATCLWIRRYYAQARQSLQRLEELVPAFPQENGKRAPIIDAQQPTAVLFVGGYTGLGIHALLTIQRLFPGHFRNIVFVSIGVVDAAAMKGIEEVERLRADTRAALERYVQLARGLGLAADYRMALGTDPIDTGEELAAEITREFPDSIFFLGNLVFQRERWFHRMLHNQTAYRLQRRLQFAGMNAMVLPVRVLEGATAT
ncbi:MAG TPA: hypothetical protein VGD27_16175, partial [Longimicrobiales bacterium]